MSLVITIIIMLILAGVVLSLTLGNNGIFKTAKMAAENYTNAQDKELADINSFVNEMLKDASDYTNNGETQQTTQELTKEQYIAMLQTLETLTNKTEELQNKVQTLENTTSSTEAVDKLKEEIQKKASLDAIYPVGSIYISTDLSTAEAVATKFGGTWESYGTGRTLVGVGQGIDANGEKRTFAVNSTGGEYTHKLTLNEMPSHNHSFNNGAVAFTLGVNIPGDTFRRGYGIYRSILA